MARDPYIAAWWLQRRNQLRAEGGWSLLRSWILPLGAAALLVPLVRPTFLAFLDLEPGRWGEGAAQLVLRASVVVIGWISIDLYGALVRGQGREVLAMLPVDAGRVARAEVIQVAVARWWLLPGIALVLSPIAASGAVALWAAAIAALASTFVLALGGGAAAHLLAIRVARAPEFAPLLDLIRGHNPRPQAAFLYAPGFVLLGSGVLIGLASESVGGAAEARPGSLALLFLPVLVGLACLRAVPGLARDTWFRGSAVLAEIDARYATLADPAEATRVYLDWIVRFLPAPWRVFALDDLRHGWRARRTLVSLGWLFGLVAFGVGWTADPAGPQRALAVAIPAVFLVAANALSLARDVPVYLRVWLPRSGAAPVAARVIVCMLWSMPAPVLAAVAAALRHGLASGALVLGLSSGAAVLAALLATACAFRPDRGLAIYAPLASVAAAAMVALVGGT